MGTTVNGIPPTMRGDDSRAEKRHQPIARFTNARTIVSSVAVSFVAAKYTGRTWLSFRFALSLKPSIRHATVRRWPRFSSNRSAR